MPGEATYHFDNILDEEEDVNRYEADEGKDEDQNSILGATRALSR